MCRTLYIVSTLLIDMTTTVGKKQNVELEQSEILLLRALVTDLIFKLKIEKPTNEDELLETVITLDTKLGLAEGKIN